MEKNIELLSIVSNALVSDRVWDEILQLTVRITASTLGFKLCSIMLVDEEEDTLVLKATQSLSQSYRSRAPLKISRSISGVAVRETRPVMVPDVLEDPRYSSPDLARAEGLVSMLSVPMMSGARAIGVLNVYTSESHEFTHEEIAVLQSVANQAAIALEGVQDALTGAYNRRYLDKSVERYLHDENSRNTPISLILLDLDYFKVINDLHGHAFGDEALRETAGSMKRVLRSTDVIIRYGGDEFLLLLPNANRERAKRVLAKTKEVVAQLSLKNRDGKRVALSVSGGIAVFPEDGESFNVLLTKADEDLYQEKISRYERV